jgi:hypothetical protein
MAQPLFPVQLLLVKAKHQHIVPGHHGAQGFLGGSEALFCPQIADFVNGRVKPGFPV